VWEGCPLARNNLPCAVGKVRAERAKKPGIGGGAETMKVKIHRISPYRPEAVAWPRAPVDL
jgi:hypothetical protein